LRTDLIGTTRAPRLLRLVENTEKHRAQLRSLNIAVVAGGFSEEAEVSLKSGTSVYHALLQRDYRAELIELGPMNRGQISRLIEFDLAVNMLHGAFGEDGSFEGLCRMLGIRSLGSPVEAAALTFNKDLTKRIFTAMGIPTPPWTAIRSREELEAKRERLAELGPPWVVKPMASGSSIGVRQVGRGEDLSAAVEKTLAEFRAAVVESYIPGRELTVAVVGVKEPFALPVVEIAPKEGWYDYRHKYEKGATELICPARLERRIAERLMALAEEAYTALGVLVLARFDVRLGEDGEAFFLEVNTIPGFTSTSLFPTAAEGVGLGYGELIECLLYLSYFEKEG